jgi:hypothetical protein
MVNYFHKNLKPDAGLKLFSDLDPQHCFFGTHHMMTLNDFQVLECHQLGISSFC